MADWDRVERQHVQAAIAECDRLGSREFLARYRFPRSHAATLWQNGEEYDPLALLGVGYLHATGRAADRADLTGGDAVAARVLTSLGFDVVVDEDELEQANARAASAQRSAAAAATKTPRAAKAPTGSAGTAPRTPRKAAAPKATTRRPEPPAPKICPTCYMAIPATGICDNCD